MAYSAYMALFTEKLCRKHATPKSAHGENRPCAWNTFVKKRANALLWDELVRIVRLKQR